jgi:DNA-binding response OmpR family regulator
MSPPRPFRGREPATHVVAPQLAGRGGDTAMTRILAVDDDPMLQHLVRLNLELDGFEVETASDGDEALEMVESFAPDLVVLDIMMPRRDGWDVCTMLKNDARYAGIPVVLLSARCQQSDMQRGREIGASAFLAKPFDPSELSSLVTVLTSAA